MRSIDLVERTGDESFDFIELKIRSDTPLYAALEVLDYGVLYAFSRINARSLNYEQGFSEILDARRIGLRVLAPNRFYEHKSRGTRETKSLDLAWLESIMLDATRRLASMIGGDTVMDFRFDVFPKTFSQDPSNHTNSGHTLAMMAGRRPLIARGDD